VPKYSRASNLVTSMISRYGGTATFTRTVSGTYNPVTQVETGGDSVTFSLPAVGMAPGKSAEYRIGSLEQRTLVELHVAPALGMTPQPGDTVSWGGSDWKVIWANAMNPATDGSPYALVYAEG
jgi:hypothetical protein